MRIKNYSSKEMKMIEKFKEFVDENIEDVYVEWSEKVIKRGPQTFAIFGCIAFDVSKMKFTSPECNPGCGKLCVPINGKYLAVLPDEGRSGIMGCYVIPDKKNKGKNILSHPCFVSCGWLYTEELNLTNEEIEDNIINDVLQGENVFTNKPAGWV